VSLKGVVASLAKEGPPAILLQKDEATLETLPIVRAQLEHRSFVLATWVKSYEAAARKQGYAEFFKREEPRIAEALWDKCWIATDDTGYTVNGWVCGRSGQLYHCYVVPQLRRLRIATRLIEHSCGVLKEYARQWPYAAHARTNPYLLGAV